MCFYKCNCGTEMNMREVEAHECGLLPPRALDAVQQGGDPQVLIEYLAAEIDSLHRKLDKHEASS